VCIPDPLNSDHPLALYVFSQNEAYKNKGSLNALFCDLVPTIVQSSTTHKAVLRSPTRRSFLPAVSTLCAERFRDIFISGQSLVFPSAALDRAAVSSLPFIPVYVSYTSNRIAGYHTGKASPHLDTCALSLY
jgi:hypothetical protein